MSEMIDAGAGAEPAKPDAESDAALLSRLGDDASKWASEFRRTAVHLGYSDMDEGWLIGWFANAIEHSESVRRAAASQPAAQPVLDLDAMRATAEALAKIIKSGWCADVLRDDNGGVYSQVSAQSPLDSQSEIVVVDTLNAWHCFDEDDRKVVAEHIAAWSPANAIAVLGMLREAEAKIATARRDGWLAGRDAAARMVARRHSGDIGEEINALRPRAEKAEARVAELTAGGGR